MARRERPLNGRLGRDEDCLKQYASLVQCLANPPRSPCDACATSAYKDQEARHLGWYVYRN